MSDLKQEAEVLYWLDGRFGAPNFLDHASDSTEEVLLISAVYGDPLHELLPIMKDGAEIFDIVAKAAAALARLHAMNISDCPFDRRLGWRFAPSKRHVVEHLLSETDEEFAAEHGGKFPIDVYNELLAARPEKEDLVFTHGDPCMPNTIFREGEFSGFVDLDGAGIADRYVDISVFLGSVRMNTPADFDGREAFCSGYGVTDMDEDKLAFYTLMDHLF